MAINTFSFGLWIFSACKCSNCEREKIIFKVAIYTLIINYWIKYRLGCATGLGLDFI